MIGMMTSYALGDVYVQEGDSYDVFVLYPYDWVSTEVDYPLLGWFSDKNDNTQIIITHMERGGDPLTDDEEINTMFGSIEERCSNTSSGRVQVEFSCSNFQPYESKTGSVNDSPKIYEINGQHAITVRASITYTMILDVDPDPELNEELRKELQEPIFTTMILTVTNIYDGYDVWQIHSTSKDYVFEDHYSSILETIQSFRILHPHEDYASPPFIFEVMDSCNNYSCPYNDYNQKDLENTVAIIITGELQDKGYTTFTIEGVFSRSSMNMIMDSESLYLTPGNKINFHPLDHSFKIDNEYTLTAINGDYSTSITWTPLPSSTTPVIVEETNSILKEKESSIEEIKIIPSWIKNNAGWWADGTIDDSTFITGIEFLVKEGIILVD